MNRPREKPSVCKICDRKFVQLSHLRRHEKIHNGKNNIKPFICKICEKSFTRLEHLRRHEILHSGERPFQCKYCSKTFTRLEQQKDHEKSHRGEKIECKYCDMKFTLPDSLRQHEKRHIKQIEKVKRESLEDIGDITLEDLKRKLAKIANVHVLTFNSYNSTFGVDGEKLTLASDGNQMENRCESNGNQMGIKWESDRLKMGII